MTLQAFWQGFNKQAASPTWLATGVAQIGQKAKNLGQALTKKPAVVQTYQNRAADPAFRLMRGASIATLGTGGALYGLNRLAQQDVHRMEGPTRYGTPPGPQM